MFYLSVFLVPVGFHPVRSGTAKVCGVSRPLLACGGSLSPQRGLGLRPRVGSHRSAALAITLCSIVWRAGRPAPFRDVLRTFAGFSALALLVARVVADHHHTTVPADDLALVADLLDARLNLHSSNLFNRRLGSCLPNLWWMSWPPGNHDRRRRATASGHGRPTTKPTSRPRFSPNRHGKRWTPGRGPGVGISSLDPPGHLCRYTMRPRVRS